MNDMDIPDSVDKMNEINTPWKASEESSVKILRPFLQKLFRYNEGLTTISDGCGTDSLHVRGHVSTLQLEKLMHERWLMVFIHSDCTLCITVLSEVTL